MRRALLVAALVVGCGSPARPAQPGNVPAAAPDPEADRAAIAEVFRTYLVKAAGGDKAGAVALIDRATMTFYEDLRRDALALTAAELKRRPLDDQITIIMFRQGKGARELRDAPIATLVAASLTTVVDPDQLRLGTITLDGDRASARPIVGEVEVAFAFDFRRDPEGWRLNFIAATQKVTAMIRDGQPDDQVIAWMAGYYKVDVEALYAPPQ